MNIFSGNMVPKTYKKGKNSILNMSVYNRMFENQELFWLGYGVLYITEMRKVSMERNPELRIKSKELAEIWFELCKRYKVLTNKRGSPHEHNGIYSFGCNVLSLYSLLNVVKRIPDKQMDFGIRQRIKKIMYTDDIINKSKIKIMKMLNKCETITTNELARKVQYNSSAKFAEHLNELAKSGLIKRQQGYGQTITNAITAQGRAFIQKIENEIEKVPDYSLYEKCFVDKQLASDLLLIISELEMGGILQTQPYLEMKSYDFVEFIRKVCEKWGWTHYKNIIKKDQGTHPATYLVGLNSKSAKEIYTLSGPCADKDKDIAFRHNFTIRNIGQHRRMGETKRNIVNLVEKGFDTSKQITLELHIGIQNIQRPLVELCNKGILKREKNGTGYHYTIS